MPELTITTPPSKDELRRRVRQNIGRLLPGLRLLAEDLPGLATRIDLVGIDENGDVVLILIASESEDVQAFTRALAERAWLAPRLDSWRKLAPEHGLRPDARTRCLLLAPEFALETRFAAEGLPDGHVTLATWRYVASEVHRTVWLEAVTRSEPGEPRSSERQREEDKRIPAFRSGLTESDLGLTVAEREELG